VSRVPAAGCTVSAADRVLVPRDVVADALDVEAMVDGVLSGRGFLGINTSGGTFAASSSPRCSATAAAATSGWSRGVAAS